MSPETSPSLLHGLLQRLPPIVLASASPRRTALLTVAGIPHRVVVRAVPEDVPAGTTPRDAAIAIARTKGDACSDLIERELVVCADTVVDLDGRILGKPTTAEEARRMLDALSGRTHRVHTAVVMRFGKLHHEVIATTAVTFRSLSAQLIDGWVASGGAFDKAGGYGIQDSIGLIGVRKIDGDYNNVVGLPVSDVVAELERLAEKLATTGRIA